ncbi:MFS transporter, partial [Streptomyces sp. NPDC095614]
QDLLEGLRYIRRHRLVGPLVVAGALCELGLIIIRTGRARSCTSSGVGGVIVPCWCGAVAQRMITALNRYKGWGH